MVLRNLDKDQGSSVANLTAGFTDDIAPYTLQYITALLLCIAYLSKSNNCINTDKEVVQGCIQIEYKDMFKSIQTYSAMNGIWTRMKEVM